MMNFKLKMKPPTITAQEHQVTVKNGKPIFYDPSKLKNAKQDLLGHLYQHQPKEPYKDAVILSVQWLFQSPLHHDGEWKTTKPDTDNLQKLLKDCMTRVGFWDDDALVVREVVEKRWVRNAPGIVISIMTAAELKELEELAT